MHGVLASCGRVALSAWRAIQYSPGFAALAEALERYISADAASTMRMPFSLPEVEEVRGQATEDARNVLLDNVEKRLRDYVSDKGVAFPIEAHLVTARR